MRLSSSERRWLQKRLEMADRVHNINGHLREEHDRALTPEPKTKAAAV